MREAHIQCLARRHLIADLNLRLVEGQTAIVSEQEAKASVDLKHAQKAGAVAVVIVQRAKTVRFERKPRKKPLQTWDDSRPSKSNLPPPPEQVFADAMAAFEKSDKKKSTTGRATSATRKKASTRRRTPESTPEATPETQDE